MSATLLPLSGALLGVLVDDLRLHLQPDSIQRSARGFLNAGREVIKDETRKAIIASIADALVRQKYAPELHALDDAPLAQPASASSLLARALEVWAHQWDQLVGGIESQTLGAVHAEAAASSYIRFAAVELAIRVAALMRLARGRPSECHCGHCTGTGIPAPHWVEATGQKLVLRQVMEQLGAKSLDDFASCIETSDKTIDEWFREPNPARPSDEAAELMATAVARKRRNVARVEVLVSLRWQLALTAIGNRLASILGRERVRDIGWAFARILASAMEFMRRSGMKEDEFRQRMLLTLMTGSRAPKASFLINTLAENEHDPTWSEAVRASAMHWGPAIETTIKIEQSKTRVAEVLVNEDGLAPAEATMLAEMVTRNVPYAATRPDAPARSKADALVRLSVQALQRDELLTSAVYLRGAVELDPDRPELHQDLGGVLGKIGRFDEGLAECHRALEMRPGWASPLVQIGIILLDAGRNIEALAHLKDVVGKIEWTVTLGHSLGIAEMRAQHYSEAIESFERVLSESPKHSSTLDLAAHCYLMLSPPDWDRGRALAKRAHAVGMHETWEALQAGHYNRLVNGRKSLPSKK